MTDVDLSIVKELGFIPHGGLRLGVANTETARVITSLGFEDITLSPELTVPRMRDIANSARPAGAIVYGKIPLMITEKCLVREISSCEDCRSAGGLTYLTDRTDARFPVRREFGHRSLIFNSLPTYTADLDVKLSFLDIHVFIFTDESADEVDRIITAYRNGDAPSNKIRRI